MLSVKREVLSFKNYPPDVVFCLPFKGGGISAGNDGRLQMANPRPSGTPFGKGAKAKPVGGDILGAPECYSFSLRRRGTVEDGG